MHLHAIDIIQYEFIQLCNTLQVIHILESMSQLIDSVLHSQTFPLELYEPDAPFRVSFTYKIVLTRNASIADVSFLFNGMFRHNVTINQTSVTVQSKRYRGFFPSGIHIYSMHTTFFNVFIHACIIAISHYRGMHLLCYSTISAL